MAGVVTGWGGLLVRRWAEPLAGTFAYTQLWDLLRAWFEVETLEEIRAVYKERDQRRYETVKALVSPGTAARVQARRRVGPSLRVPGKACPGCAIPEGRRWQKLKAALLLRVGIAFIVLRALWTLFRYPILVAVFWLLAKAGECL